MPKLDERAKLIRVLEKQLNLAKKTIVAFAEAAQKQSHGHSDGWEKAARMLEKCEDEMDIDDNE